MRARSALVAALERAGFTLARCNNHAIWRCPCGHTQIVMSRTPGKGRATWNADAQIARTLRACEQRRAAA
jgi:hypothetical protein